jgi:hypothetical protein
MIMRTNKITAVLGVSISLLAGAVMADSPAITPGGNVPQLPARFAIAPGGTNPQVSARFAIAPGGTNPQASARFA